MECEELRAQTYTQLAFSTVFSTIAHQAVWPRLNLNGAISEPVNLYIEKVFPKNDWP